VIVTLGGLDRDEAVDVRRVVPVAGGRDDRVAVVQGEGEVVGDAGIARARLGSVLRGRGWALCVLAWAGAAATGIRDAAMSVSAAGIRVVGGRRSG